MSPRHKRVTGDERCVAVREVLARVGDKWSVQVIVILGEGTKRFTELKRAIEGISQRMLTLTLRALERDGLVTRTVYADVPLRVDYILTPLGRTLLAPVETIAAWAQDHRQEIQRARDMFDERFAATRTRRRVRSTTITSIAALIISLACGAPVRSVPSHAPVETRPGPPPQLSALERDTVDAVNRERERRGLAPLSVSSTLTRIARAHSAYQAKVGKSEHEGEGGSLPVDRARAGGIAWSVLGENVAMNLGYSDPVATAVGGWMMSAPHRKNILNPVFEQTGVGIVTAEDGTIYFTEMFLDPAN
jgi:DNA-binding HxlR family transcriptional regulator/uncharacterized protein YkwD